MTNNEFKQQTISKLFRSRTIHLKIEGMLFRFGLNRGIRDFVEPEIISETFLQLSKMNEDKFYDKFYNNPSQLEATTVLIAKNIGIRNSSPKLGADGQKNPKGCLMDELRFASSYMSSQNNVLEPTENNIDYDGMSDNGVSNSVLEQATPDINDKNQIFEYLKEKLTADEMELLDQLTNQKLTPGRKKAQVQLNIDLLKSKLKVLLTAYSTGYYRQRTWSIGEEMSRYKNDSYKYLDDEAA